MASFGAGIAVGVLIGAIAGAGGMYVWKSKKADGPEVAAATAKVDAGPAGAKGKKGKRRGGGRRVSGGGGSGGGGGGEGDFGMDGEGGGDVPVVSAEDLKLTVEGDVLKVRDRTIDMGADSPPTHDLSQQEIDDAFHGVSGEIIQCITDARGAAPVNGKVVVGVVADPGGRVIKTRVEAPRYLLQHGLYGCVKRTVASLRFPAPGRDSVMSVPFTVE
jgi:hypothetical protein